MTEDRPITLADAAPQSRLERRREIHRRSNKKRYAADPEKRKAMVAAWQRKNPGKTNAASARWRQKNKEALRWRRLLKTYGVTQTIWNMMFEAQGFSCSICQAKEPGAKHGWHTDHKHGTRIVRGILCHQCNTMLGRARDNAEILRRGASYLEEPVE